MIMMLDNDHFTSTIYSLTFFLSFLTIIYGVVVVVVVVVSMMTMTRMGTGTAHSPNHSRHGSPAAAVNNSRPPSPFTPSPSSILKVGWMVGWLVGWLIYNNSVDCTYSSLDHL